MCDNWFIMHERRRERIFELQNLKIKIIVICMVETLWWNIIFLKIPTMLFYFY